MFLSRAQRLPHRRSFVSTVLLSRTWECETVVELRKEARTRGLSTGGNKAALIARIQEHEQNAPPQTRTASTNTKTTVQAASPGIPLAAQTTSAPNPDFAAIKLPDLTRPPHDPPVQVPYVPDFWNSARPKAHVPLEPPLPKLHVVSGSVTHYDGGPTYNLEKHHEGDQPASTIAHVVDPPPTKEVGFWADLWDSLGLPRSFSIRRTLSEATHAREHDLQTHSRPLTDEEKKGLYVLLGIVAGSWLVAGFVNRPAVVAEEDETHGHH